ARPSRRDGQRAAPHLRSACRRAARVGTPRSGDLRRPRPLRFRLRAGFRRALIALIVLTALDGCHFQSRPSGTDGVNWFPGYYVLGHGTTFNAKQKILDDPLVAPFTGV